MLNIGVTFDIDSVNTLFDYYLWWLMGSEVWMFS